MNLILATHLAYLAISVAVTVWVARTLHRNGRVFLMDCFHGNMEVADSINHLLVVGFYLVNIGFIALALRFGIRAEDPQAAVETLGTKIGLVMLVLGIMHFINLRLFTVHRRRALLERARAEMPAPPPLPIH